jgi:branched-subunit amino acid aminotransferase/4-amino-4-deoxychorismate lyase
MRRWSYEQQAGRDGPDRVSRTLIETVRVRGGRASLWALHVQRLRRSCRALGVPLPRELEPPAGGPDRVWRLAADASGLVVTERQVGPAEPVSLATSAVAHRPYPHKTTDRAQFDEAAASARAIGADDGLLLTREGYVAETSIWTLLWWEDDRLCAPAFDLGILPSIARARIGELAEITERRLPREGLAGRPLLVANAARGIVQVKSLDGVPVPGAEATAALQARFWP